MVIAIDLLRKPDTLAQVRESEKRRFRDGKIVDEVLALDEQWKKAQFNWEQKRKEIGIVQKDITERKKTSKGADKCEELLKKKEDLEKDEDKLKQTADGLAESREQALGKIGNVLHDSVPVFEDEKDNERVAIWGKPRVFTAKYGTNGFRPHFELLEMLGAVEFEAGQDVAGNRAYYLTGPGVLLNQALINYGIAFLTSRGYTPVQPPFFMKKDLMGKTAELADYDDVLYKVIEDKEKPELDKYLIATSEQPLSAFHRGQNIAPERFPLRYAGISSCFRREAGSSGRDIRGIFRVHQFEKVEQFTLTHPDESWKEHDKMIEMAEEFYQSLGLPYHVVAIISREINNAAAKKFDLEAWFPGDKEGAGQYRELVSCSNCTDYQARCMNTKCGYRPEDPFAHMLNSTLCATERAMCCVVENYQEETGVRVPRVLVPYMLGQEFLPFTKTLKSEESNTKKAAPKKDAAAKPKAEPKKEEAKKPEPKKAEKKEAAPKAEGKKDKKKDDGEEKPKTAEEIAEERKVQKKKSIKEGGKRGVEIEGAADMGGLQYFCTSVDAPSGDLEMLQVCLEAMNAKSDPTDEERKGGSGHIGKMIFSAGTEQLAVAACVPEAKLGELNCEEWLKAVLATQGGKVESTSKTVCIGSVKADGNKNIFPLKIREPMIIEANNFLRKKGLFPEDNSDDDDELVFGDDDFPS
jgi:seryl-tRNA synthetase